ncbi:thioredoxin-disulfide reductase [Streptomyces fradiae]|uniref:thioredoxin-disulfide reductase n=1 Tax=Streptomyces fradiae TaxID=1906 RepID=UPI0036B72F22
MSGDVRNVLVIGSGPAGYTAALYTARADLRPLVLLGAAGGGALATTTEVENYPGFPAGVRGPDLVDGMAAQAQRFGAELLGAEAVAVELTGDVKRVIDGTGREHLARTVVIATGTRARTLGLAGEAELTGHGVSSCATCDGFFFRGQDIAVVGGGDTALEEATFLSRYARTVTVVHRRDELRASKVLRRRAFADPKVSFAFEREVSALHGDARTGLTGLTLRHTATGATEELPVTGLFVAIGHDPRTELFTGRLALDAAGYVRVEAPSSRTGVPGVFAAGDVADPVYRQAVTAAGTGCVAALDAERYLSGLGDRELSARHGEAALPGTGA